MGADQGPPPHAGRNFASAPGPASRSGQWCAQKTIGLAGRSSTPYRLRLCEWQAGRWRSLNFEVRNIEARDIGARNMPDREEEGAGTSVEGPGPSMPPSYPRIPASFPTEHGKMARVEFLMLSATPKYCPLHLWLSVLFVRGADPRAGNALGSAYRGPIRGSVYTVGMLLGTSCQPIWVSRLRPACGHSGKAITQRKTCVCMQTHHTIRSTIGRL